VNSHISSTPGRIFAALWAILGRARTDGIYIALAAFAAGAGLFVPAFLSAENITDIMRTVAITGVIAAGQTVVAISGGLADLSVGSVVGLSGVLALGLQPSLGVGLAATIALIVGLVVGYVNGVLVGSFRTNAVVTTIGTSVAVSGIALWYTNGNTIFGGSVAFSSFGTGSIAGIPNIVVAFIFVVAATHFVLARTELGRRIYATGGGYEAARASGIRVERVIHTAFLLAAATAALAGILLAALLAQVNYDSGASYTFNTIAAVAVGGTSLFGGQGSVVRTLAGILIIGILNNIVVLLGLPLNAQVIVTGAAILLAVALDVWLSRRGGS
jgi:ribose transport system permease protein